MSCGITLIQADRLCLDSAFPNTKYWEVFQSYLVNIYFVDFLVFPILRNFKNFVNC